VHTELLHLIIAYIYHLKMYQCRYYRRHED